MRPVLEVFIFLLFTANLASACGCERHRMELNHQSVRPLQPVWQQRPTAVSSQQFRPLDSTCGQLKSVFSYPAHLVSKMRIGLVIGPKWLFAGTEVAYFRSLKCTIYESDWSTSVALDKIKRAYPQSSSHATAELRVAHPSGQTELQEPLKPRTSRRPSPLRVPPTKRTRPLLLPALRTEVKTCWNFSMKTQIVLLSLFQFLYILFCIIIPIFRLYLLCSNQGLTDN